MSKWGIMCWVAQTVCDEVSEEFYERYGREITDYFGSMCDEYGELDDNITEWQINAYCLGIVLRNEMVSDFDFKKVFY